MASDRLEKMKKTLEALKQRRFEFVESLGSPRRGGEEGRLIEELLKVHEAINVLRELIAEEERSKRSE